MPQDGVTPLHIAAQIGKEGMVRLLLQEGADTNAADKVIWGYEGRDGLTHCFCVCVCACVCTSVW